MIADAAHVREVGNLPASVTDALLKPHIRTAGTRLKAWVTSTVYAASETAVQAARDALGMGETLDVDDLDAQERALIDAEAYLALVAALPSLNMVMHDNAGVAISGKAGQTDFQYLYPAALKNMQEQYLRNAEEAAAGYIEQANLSPSSSPAYDSDGDAIE